MSPVFAATWLRKGDTTRMERKVNFMMGVLLYRISDKRDDVQISARYFMTKALRKKISML
jgi:hypothetical protein